MTYKNMKKKNKKIQYIDVLILGDELRDQIIKFAKEYYKYKKYKDKTRNSNYGQY